MSHLTSIEIENNLDSTSQHSYGVTIIILILLMKKLRFSHHRVTGLGFKPRTYSKACVFSYYITSTFNHS